jgi:hypothetical protein
MIIKLTSAATEAPIIIGLMNIITIEPTIDKLHTMFRLSNGENLAVIEDFDAVSKELEIMAGG